MPLWPQLPNIPYTPAPAPRPTQLPADTFVVDGVQVYGVIADGRPCLVLQFRAAGQALPPVLLTHLDGIVELVREAVASVRPHDGMANPDDVPPTSEVRCSGCDRRIFGDRAAAGSCTTCARDSAESERQDP